MLDKVDLHTHTIASGHAYNTRNEMLAAAKAKGVRFGKPVIPLPDNFPELYQEWTQSHISLEELAKICNMGRSTMYKRIGEYRQTLQRENI